MKVLTYLATLLAGLAYTVCLLVWLLSGLPTLSPAAIVVSAQAPTAFASAAWLMGAGRILAGANSGDRNSSGVWWRRAGLALTVYAAIMAFLPPLVAGAMWFPSAVVLVSGLALVAGSSPLGGWILRRETNELPSVRMPTAERQLAIGGGLVGAASQAIFWVSLWQSGSAADPALVLLEATQLSLFGSGIAALIAGVLLRDRILNDARVNPDHVRVLHRVVYRGERLPQNGNLHDQAIRYAVAVPHLLFFQLVFLPLLFLSQALQMYLSAARGGVAMLPQFMTIALAVAVVLVTAYYLRQGRAGRRFALEQTVTP